MKLGKFTATKLICLIFAMTLLAGLPAQAQNFREGVDYFTLSGDATVRPDGRVEVIEFFWFGCPSCFAFEPLLLAWQKPDSVHFVTIPTILNRVSEFHAHAYYAMELTSLNQQLMQPFYDELHVRKSRIVNADTFQEWAAAQPGVDAELLTGTIYSFAAQTRVSQANLLADKYGITGVPTLVIGGKYKTSPATAGSGARSLQVVEYLVQRVLAEQQ